jgi:hypothetical protein
MNKPKQTPTTPEAPAKNPTIPQKAPGGNKPHKSNPDESNENTGRHPDEEDVEDDLTSTRS